MTEFHWIDWNLNKIDAHALSREEVEHAWHHRRDLRDADDPDYGPRMESIGRCPSGRAITIVWRYNEIDGEPKVFVITAY
jgi:hypothetical protein